MSKEKQIEKNQIDKMERDIFSNTLYSLKNCKIIAKALYKTNYRKQSEGEWRYDEDCECYVCSVCEHSALNNYRLLSTPSNFCPNCGAKMKGGAE